MERPETFRSRLAQGLAVLTGLVALAALVGYVSEQGPTALLASLAPVALVGVVAWAVFWNPRVVVSEEGITIVNLARTVHVPWAAFAQADTRWALNVTTTAGTTFTSWAVPAGSGFGARLAPSRQQRGEWAPAQRKLASPGTAEAAAMAIAERVRERKERATTGEVPSTTDQVRTDVHVVPLSAIAALVALTVVSVALS